MIPHIPSSLHIDSGFWYLASPYSKYAAGLHAATQDVARAAAQLIKAGVPVFSPIAHTHTIAMEGRMDPLDHSIWLPLDEPMMEAAHGLLVVKMPGWQTSYGINVEKDAFANAGKPVSHLEWCNE